MSNKEEVTVTKAKSSVLQDRKTYWYTVGEIKNAAICPSCGSTTDKFKKNITAHVKRCFSIKKIGPIYRLHGYVECKCGFLIADNTKAQKLHVCMGEVPAFEPDLSYMSKTAAPTVHLNRELLMPKPWIRNFVSPFKLDIENIQANPKTKPRVRNFEMPASNLEPQNVSVYSISSSNGTILIKGQDNRNVLTIRKRVLRLPRIKGYACS
ncbi:uncharacterized protein LOC6560800 [Drosophila grimshawi]|uniref:GH21924 n=1 Tax=Drosophila grimshawi TaxID=7222 RepID=B4J8F4_DROGR|nr:uncharacterized protein LOC6560800 [Drosophila grimshawi]XP_032591094.1 uncharacterized protein LOC6560800 [Drosophila grimshawi]EDW02313.1 GH21924 [Drosophila grimshawi]